MTNQFVSVLDKIGTIGKDIWKVAATSVEDVTRIAQAAEPIVDIAFPTVAPLYNMTVTLVGNAEGAAAAAGVQKAGKQKMALVLAALLPYALQEAAALGLSAPTQAQLTKYVDSVVDGLKALGSL